jgi:hypothetical protein
MEKITNDRAGFERLMKYGRLFKWVSVEYLIKMINGEDKKQ